MRFFRRKNKAAVKGGEMPSTETFARLGAVELGAAVRGMSDEQAALTKVALLKDVQLQRDAIDGAVRIKSLDVGQKNFAWGMSAIIAVATVVLAFLFFPILQLPKEVFTTPVLGGVSLAGFAVLGVVFRGRLQDVLAGRWRPNRKTEDDPQGAPRP